MKDEFDELVEELDLDEVEDFDAKPAKYDVYSYNNDALVRLAASDAHFVSIEVETTVEREDSVENVGTLFAEGIQIK